MHVRFVQNFVLCFKMSNSQPRLIKARPIDSRYARKLQDHRPKDFVTATTSQADFYAGNIVNEQDDEESDDEIALTEDEKNKLGAKIIKAEMMGNLDLVSKLKLQLASGKKPAPQNDSQQGDRDVILTKTDLRTGLTIPLQNKRTDGALEGKKKKPKVDMDRDSELTINDLVKQEKMTTAEEQLAMFGASSSKVVASQKTDELWTVDDVLMSKKEKNPSQKLANQERSRAIAAHQKQEHSLASCTFCIDSGKFLKHLVVAMGLKTYLAVPEYQPLVEGHCCIVPMSHVSSCIQMDEDIYDEMQIWRKGLAALFRQQNKDVVFLETAKNIRHQPHCLVDCIPVPKRIGDMAPIYFKKAIMECEEEWAQNKKLVDLRQKDIRRSIPKGFSYFAVDFGLQSGYAHVIEDENLFKTSFGKEIVAGMMDLDHNLWRKPMKQTFDEQVKRTSKFKTVWAPFDWTERVKTALKND